MDDWNSDTCIGDYLRTMYDLRIDKGDTIRIKGAVHSYTKVMVVNFILMLMV